MEAVNVPFVMERGSSSRCGVSLWNDERTHRSRNIVHAGRSGYGTTKNNSEGGHMLPDRSLIATVDGSFTEHVEPMIVRGCGTLSPLALGQDLRSPSLFPAPDHATPASTPTARCCSMR